VGATIWPGQTVTVYVLDVDGSTLVVAATPLGGLAASRYRRAQRCRRLVALRR
jgi:hypothetical protein